MFLFGRWLLKEASGPSWTTKGTSDCLGKIVSTRYLESAAVTIECPLLTTYLTFVRRLLLLMERNLGRQTSESVKCVSLELLLMEKLQMAKGKKKNKSSAGLSEKKKEKCGLKLGAKGFGTGQLPNKTWQMIQSNITGDWKEREGKGKSQFVVQAGVHISSLPWLGSINVTLGWPST